jgi:putative ABC transport system permease protein
MLTLLVAILTQSITFLPLALAIYVSFYVLRATDMTLDGSFVLGAAVFARSIELGYSPALAGICALCAGASAGIGVSCMQRGQKIDSLLAGVLATFILMSVNLIVMGRPNIGLLSQTTLLSSTFAKGELAGWSLTAFYSGCFAVLTILLLLSRGGLVLRALGDNPTLLQRLGKPIESYRMFGFAFTNGLAAASGCLTAQTIGYADIGMGFGVTLTALGTVILGKQLLLPFLHHRHFCVAIEFFACCFGVLFYFFITNGLLRLNVNPLYLKMMLGIILVVFLRAASHTIKRGVS